MLTVELVYDRDCPNVEAARAQLRRALAETGHALHWQEWRGDDPRSPGRVRGYGSPTILVCGQDVEAAVGGGDGDGACCRLYSRPDGCLAGVPSVETIASALRKASGGLAEPDPDAPAETD